MKTLLALAGWLGIVFVAGAIGAVASVQAPEFYLALERPAWAPPPSVFGPVWTVLYVMMGFAAWLSRDASRPRLIRVARSLFVTQLVLNSLWSWLFFAWRQGALAFVEIAGLWILLVATVIAFWRIRPIAGALLVPYLLWVSFAAALNFSVWRLNPALL